MSDTVKVTAAVLVKNGSIFIACRGPGDPLAGRWELPGGKVENGESPEQCLAREMKEEFNLAVSVKEFLGSSIHRYDQTVIELLVYRVTWIHGEPVPLVHSKFEWALPGELKHYVFAPADMPFIRKLERGQIDLQAEPEAG